MPRGDNQKGGRRGKYDKTTSAYSRDVGDCDHSLSRGLSECKTCGAALVGAWSVEDTSLYLSLVADSPLTSTATKESAARRAVEAHRQCVTLDAMARSADDDANLCKASTQFRKQLELLKVAEKVRDDEDEL